MFVFIYASTYQVFPDTFSTPLWHQVTKPLLMLSLGLYYFLSVQWNSTTALVLAAILFSLLGDSFLMYEEKDEIYFMLGLGSFLLAHIFYAIAYPKLRREKSDPARSAIEH